MTGDSCSFSEYVRSKLMQLFKLLCLVVNSCVPGELLQLLKLLCDAHQLKFLHTELATGSFELVSIQKAELCKRSVIFLDWRDGTYYP